MEIITIDEKPKRKRRKKRKKRSRSKRTLQVLVGNRNMKRRKRRKYSRSSQPSRRRRTHRTSVNFDIADVLVNGAIAGVGAVGNVFVANSISKLLGGVSQQTRNLILVATAIASGYLLSKTQFRKYAPAITTGALVIAMFEIAKTSFGTDLLTLSGFGNSDSIAEIVDNLDLSQIGYSSEGLLGVYEQDGLGLIEGDNVEEYL